MFGAGVVVGVGFMILVEQVRHAPGLNGYIYALSYALNWATGGDRRETLCSRIAAKTSYPECGAHWTSLENACNWLFAHKEPDHCWRSHIRFRSGLIDP